MVRISVTLDNELEIGLRRYMVVSRGWWKSEKASRSGELSHNSRPPMSGFRRMTPWRGIAGVTWREKARLRS